MNKNMKPATFMATCFDFSGLSLGMRSHRNCWMRQVRVHRVQLVMSALLALFPYSLAFATDRLYDFTFIADGRTADLLGYALGSTLSINNQGMVSYQIGKSPVTEVRISDGVDTSVIITATTGSGFGVVSPMINNLGQVVYLENLNGTPLVRVWSDGNTSTLYGPHANVKVPTGGISDNLTWSQVINNALAIRGPGGVLIASGVTPGTANQRPSISRNGTYASTASFMPGNNWGLSVLSSSGALSSFVVASQDDVSRVSTAVNNYGIAAFVAEPTVAATGRSFVGAIDVRAVTPSLISIADSGSTDLYGFGSSAGGVAINNLNEISYIAGTMAGGRDHLFVSDVGARAPVEVLKAGDTVTSGVTLRTFAAGMDSSVMNDKGQIAFLAHLRVGNTNFDAIIRADPLPGVSPANPILPIPGQIVTGGGWRFQPGLVNGPNGSVRMLPRGIVRFIDPDIAVGYDYEIEGGGPNFGSVYVPAPLPNGDASFQVEFSGRSFNLIAGQYFDFTSVVSEGVSAFRVTGINIDEALDPLDRRAFVTGLSFMEGGEDEFSMLMRPIVAAVPEPPIAVQMALGLFAVVGVAGRIRRRQLLRLRHTASEAIVAAASGIPRSDHVR
jgi:hypothetical protein